MAQLPFAHATFRQLFIACWCVWTALQTPILIWYGLPVATALTDSISSNVLLFACCYLGSFVLRFYLPKQRRYGYLFSLCLVLTAVWFATDRAFLMLVIPDDAAYVRFYFHSVPIRVAIAFLVIGCAALASVLWYVLGDQQEAERRRRDAEQLAKEAELYKLRQQLQPHFLFNSLNSINALVTRDPVLARTMIQQLSDFLRGTVKREDNTWITLEEELAQLQLYLQIEKVRFGHRLCTEIVNNIIKHNTQLPSMLLQPVVENAIKFGLYDTTGAVTIRILVETEHEDLKITVSNPFDAATAGSQRGTGFGLASVQRRLYLLFARTDLLQTKTADREFITTLKIPQRDQRHHH